jgi:hypothetical protein
MADLDRRPAQGRALASEDSRRWWPQLPEPSRIDRVTIRAELDPESSDRLKQAH